VGPHLLMAKMLYGCGLRLMKCVCLRVQDLDMDRNILCVVQELMGHTDVITTEIYTHIMEKDISAVSSPLDRLLKTDT